MRSDGGDRSSDEKRNFQRVVAYRLREADLPTERFIDVENGQKQSFDHEQRCPGSVSGNYGVYSGAGLVGFDIDDYQDGVDASHLEALPETFTVETPHGGEHRYYRDAEAAAATIRAATGGSGSVSLSWGEIYAGSKYFVGPGSRIEECGKEGCEECERHGGFYSVKSNHSIAEITLDQVTDVLDADPGFSDPQVPLVNWVPLGDSDRNCVSDNRPGSEQPDGQLWRQIVHQHRHAAGGPGVEIAGVLDEAQESGVDPKRACKKIKKWIENDHLKKSTTTNRIAPWSAKLPDADGETSSVQAGLDSFQ